MYLSQTIAFLCAERNNPPGFRLFAVFPIYSTHSRPFGWWGGTVYPQTVMPSCPFYHTEKRVVNDESC